MPRYPKSILEPMTKYPKNWEGLLQFCECDPDASKRYIAFMDEFGFFDKGSNYGVSSWFHREIGYESCTIWLPRFDFEGRFRFTSGTFMPEVPKMRIRSELRSAVRRKVIREEIINPFNAEIINEFEIYDSIESLSSAPFSIGNKETMDYLINNDAFALFLIDDVYLLNNYKKDISIQLGMKAFNSDKIIGFKRNILRAIPYETEIKLSMEIIERKKQEAEFLRSKSKDFWINF